MCDETEARRLGINIEIYRQLTRPREKIETKNAYTKPRDFGTVFNNVTPNTKVTWDQYEELKDEKTQPFRTHYVIPKKSQIIPPPRTPPGTPPSSRPSTPIPMDADINGAFEFDSSAIEEVSTKHKRRSGKHTREHKKHKKDKIDKRCKSHKKHRKPKLVEQ